MNVKIKLIFSAFFIALQLFGQDKPSSLEPSGGAYPLQIPDSQNPCITEEQYKNLEQEVNTNCKMLNIETALLKGGSVTSFAWPLQAASGFTNCDYYLTGNYVDQDATTGIEDYNCGSVTYNGHKGLDIVSFPYAFYKMDHDQVEIIAAASGTIIAKVSGQADKNCTMNSLSSNYVIILHADGSRAFYLHMKMNSLTSKAIGQTVTSGEFLGLVGSSGSSTTPHLHFEVWTANSASTVIDPYAGTCNLMNSSTWWAAQKPYTEPAIVAVQVNTTLAQFPACPATEVPNDLDCVNPAVTASFYIFLRNETIGLTKSMKILGPNNTTFNTWTAQSNANYKGSYWYWNYNTPSVPGTYTFEATYNGKICSKVFQVGCTTVGISKDNGSRIDLKVISTPEELLLYYEGLANSQTRVTLTSAGGQTIIEDSFLQESSPYKRSVKTSDITNGVYFLSSETSHGRIVKKIIIQHN